MRLPRSWDDYEKAKFPYIFMPIDHSHIVILYLRFEVGKELAK